MEGGIKESKSALARPFTFTFKGNQSSTLPNQVKEYTYGKE
ncbi:hypothetical protein D1BOALGB6SA_10088 [Olavius sp. associated proteobacterium Delta 1]|nr:hypothetical protein D1BOALGB6SA_10088 [Olavius sp. associated proteobacterium Delta 1]